MISLGRIFALILILFWELNSDAQLLNSVALDSTRTFYSIENALKNPDQVYKLKLSKKKLGEFPIEILQFKNLNSLNLSKNKLKRIPDEIAQLSFLQEINFSKNKIDSFPQGLCSAIHLKKIDMSQNWISDIPENISNLKKLELLDLWSNDIGEFPDELKELENLKELDLRVIQISNDDQERISKLLPNTKIHLSNSCNCF